MRATNAPRSEARVAHLRGRWQKARRRLTDDLQETYGGLVLPGVAAISRLTRLDGIRTG